MKPSVPFENYLIAKLEDPDYAKVYLETALEEYSKDRDADAFLLALRDIAVAQGGLRKLASETNLNHAGIYRALGTGGNPKLDTLEKILRSLGFRLSVEPLVSEKVADTV